MRKILSYEEREALQKKNKRNQILVGLALILLMLFSTVGFAFNFGVTGDVIEEVEFNGVEFVRDLNTGYWVFTVGGNEYFTVYSPEEVADIEFINYKTIQNFAGKPLYFIGDPGNGFAEIYRVLGSVAQRVGGACLDESCEEDYPIKDCSKDNIIIMEELSDDNDENESSNKTIEALELNEGIVNEEIVNEQIVNEEIVTDVNCVYIRAKPENLVKYADAYLYDLLGIK